MRIIKKAIIKKIYKKIKSYDKIVIARHTSPDPDAIASQTALRDTIKLTFPNKDVVAVGMSVAKFKYFGLLDKIDVNNYENALLIVLDVPNFYRVDGITDLKYKEVIKIDHHPKEDIVGDLDWTDESASAACELLAELVLNTPLKMDQKIASNLYLGIVSDSDRFLLTGTTMRTFGIISELIKKAHLDFTSLYYNLYKRSLDEIRFQGYLQSNIKVTDTGLGYLIIPASIIKEYNVDFSTPSNLINNFNFIEEMIVWCFITEDPKNQNYKVNIRSRGPIINKVAANFHGGGHKFASGAKAFSEEEIDKLIHELEEACISYNRDKK